jgi:hypothetical protein
MAGARRRACRGLMKWPVIEKFTIRAGKKGTSIIKE